MTYAEELVERTLAIVRDRAEAEAVAHAGRSSLTRFANSFIHQNVSEDEATVSLRIATDDEGLRRFVDRAIALADDQPVDHEWPGFGSPIDVPNVDHWDEGTAADDPADRADAVREFVDAGEGMLAAGYCQTEAIHKAYGNTSGRTAWNHQAWVPTTHQVAANASGTRSESRTYPDWASRAEAEKASEG